MVHTNQPIQRPSNRLRILQAWRSYEAQVLPADAGQVQRTETCRAFYAGAWAMFNATMSVDDLSEDAAEQLLAELEEECQAFMEAVKQGDA